MHDAHSQPQTCLPHDLRPRSIRVLGYPRALAQVSPSFSGAEDPIQQPNDKLLKATFSFPENARAFLYLLFEHQSSEDPRMALSLLTYILRIWERFAQEHPSPAKLPAILPVALAQGKRPWKTSTPLEELIGLPPAVVDILRPWQPKKGPWVGGPSLGEGFSIPEPCAWRRSRCWVSERRFF
ncbi:MAG: YhgA-like [Verrucomicrobia bacterium]|nr:MAG: YhgA-like [Verrucomicrobiota bacterium]